MKKQIIYRAAFYITGLLLLALTLTGIGLGTILSVIGVGRVIAFFNHFAKEKMTELAGVED